MKQPSKRPGSVGASIGEDQLGNRLPIPGLTYHLRSRRDRTGARRRSALRSLVATGFRFLQNSLRNEDFADPKVSSPSISSLLIPNLQGWGCYAFPRTHPHDPPSSIYHPCILTRLDLMLRRVTLRYAGAALQSRPDMVRFSVCGPVHHHTCCPNQCWVDPHNGFGHRPGGLWIRYQWLEFASYLIPRTERALQRQLQPSGTWTR